MYMWITEVCLVGYTDESYKLSKTGWNNVLLCVM